MQQFVQLVRFDTGQSGLFVDHAFVQQVDSDLDHGSTCTLTVTCLQEPEFTLLYGELHILHIFIVIFQFCLQFIQLLVDFRHSLFHRGIFGYTFLFRDACTVSPTTRADDGDLLRCTDTGNHVFTLCIDQVLTVEEIFTVTSVTREANTGC